MAEIDNNNFIDRIIDFFVANQGELKKTSGNGLGKVNAVWSAGDKIITSPLPAWSRYFQCKA